MKLIITLIITKMILVAFFLATLLSCGGRGGGNTGNTPVTDMLSGTWSGDFST